MIVARKCVSSSAVVNESSQAPLDSNKKCVKIELQSQKISKEDISEKQLKDRIKELEQQQQPLLNTIEDLKKALKDKNIFIEESCGKFNLSETHERSRINSYGFTEVFLR